MITPDRIDLWDVEMPLRTPMATADGIHRSRRSILVRVRGRNAEGWGEAAPVAGHTMDDIDEAWEIVRIESARTLAAEDPTLIDGSSATAALDAAITSWQAAGAGESLASHLGGTPGPVEASAAIGLAESTTRLLDAVAGAMAAGHRHVKLKIAPGHVQAAAVVRAEFPELGIAVDANGSFDRRHIDELLVLDDLGLAYIEQPLSPLDLSGHATLRSRISIPICLDESLRRLGDIVTIAAAGAASAIVIKPGRLGPTLAARALALAGRHHLDVKIGGLFSTGVGKALDVAVATHPQVSLPSDLAASSHWFRLDLVDPPWRLEEGAMAAPPGPGLGIEVVLDRVQNAANRHLRMPG